MVIEPRRSAVGAVKSITRFRRASDSSVPPLHSATGVKLWPRPTTRTGARAPRTADRSSSRDAGTIALALPNSTLPTQFFSSNASYPFDVFVSFDFVKFHSRFHQTLHQFFPDVPQYFMEIPSQLALFRRTFFLRPNVLVRPNVLRPSVPSFNLYWFIFELPFAFFSTRYSEPATIGE